MNSFSELLEAASCHLTDRGRQIISILSEIDASTVDMDRTALRVYEKDQLVSVKVFSPNDVYCPVAIVLGTGSRDGTVYFYYDDSGAVLDEKASTDVEAECVRSAIRHHLTAEVVEERTLVKGQLVRVSHKFTYPENGHLRWYPFLSVFKSSWPWSSKIVERRTYKPWPLRSLDAT